MTVRRVMHTAISTPDLDRAIEFWAHLGFVATREWSWPEGTAHVDGFLGLPASAARAALLEGPGGALELFEFATPDHGAGTDRDHASSIARAESVDAGFGVKALITIAAPPSQSIATTVTITPAP